MDLSSREIEITRSLLKNPSGLRVEDLMANLQVSKRTVYRELAQLETSLQYFDIQLSKTNGRYQLQGATSQLQQLQRGLKNAHNQSIIQTSRTRRSAVACKLLLAADFLTMQALADEFQVSKTTIMQDLQTIEQIFQDYQIQLQRMKAKGLRVVGAESHLRRVLGGILASEINEYELFAILDAPPTDLQKSTTVSQYFINLLKPQLLHQASQALKLQAKTEFAHLSDKQLKQLLLMLTISAQRIEQQHPIRQLPPLDQDMLFKYQYVAIQLFNQFGQAIQQQVTLLEVEFMAGQIAGMNFSMTNNLFLDDYDIQLSYQVRSLIQYVSQAFHYDFQKDDSLFDDLMLHLGSALQRQVSKLPEINNPVLHNVIEKYPQLYRNVAAGLQEIFNEQLSASEVAYVLLHFASAFEQQRQHSPISVLIVCANGIGTVKILEKRLKMTIPEISQYQVSRIADLKKLNLKDYDLILSTIFLPGFHYPFKVVSPLLLTNEVQEIKDYLQERFGTLQVNVSPKVSNEMVLDAQLALNQLLIDVDTAQNLLNNVELQTIDNRHFDLADTLNLLTQRLRPRFIQDAAQVAQALYQRQQTAPVGIPQSHLGLLHTTNAAIIQPLFAIYELTHPLEITGMDYQPLLMRRCLLLLAPANTSEFILQLLGNISSSIIEDQHNLLVYDQGQLAQVKQLIAQLTWTMIKEKYWK